MTAEGEPPEPSDSQAVEPIDEPEGDGASPGPIPPELAEAFSKLVSGGADDADSSGTAIIQATFASMVASSGPLPHPDTLRQYNDIIPDGADRILKMAEQQSAHRIAIEASVTKSDGWRANFGLAAGLVFALSTLGVSALVTLKGYPEAGIFLGTLDLAAIVGTFVYGTENRRRERREQRESLTPG